MRNKKEKQQGAMAIKCLAWCTTKLIIASSSARANERSHARSRSEKNTFFEGAVSPRETTETTVWEALNNALLDSDSDNALQCNNRNANLSRAIKKLDCYRKVRNINLEYHVEPQI